MSFLELLFEAILSLLLSCFTQKNKRIEKKNSDMDMIEQRIKGNKIVKILNIEGMKEKKVLKFLENNSILSEYCSSFIYPFLNHQLNKCNKQMILERYYYLQDLEEVIQNISLSRSGIYGIICGTCDVLMMLNENDITLKNLKSSNIIYGKDGEIKLCDLLLNELRREDEMRLYDICFKSPEELSGLECKEKSVIWSIGCILYEMICKKLPFNEDNDIMKTKENILKCKYSLDRKCDDIMKEMIFRMLKVRSDDRMTLRELKKEMIKMSEILKDKDNNVMMYKERKEILYKNDYSIEISPFDVLHELEYYKEDDLIEMYNKKADDRVLAFLLNKYLFIRFNLSYLLRDKLKFQIYHQCEYDESNVCYLDWMLFNMNSFKNTLYISIKKQCIHEKQWRGDCFCCCKEGIRYFFKIIKLMLNTKSISMYNIKNIPIENQSLFGSCFSQLSNLEELELFSCCHLTSEFIKSFVKSIPKMKLKYLDLHGNPIGLNGFKMLLPYLHLLINKYGILNLSGMNLDDEAMILLSKELYKYPNLKKINIRENDDIHSKGLKALPYKFTFT